MKRKPCRATRIVALALASFAAAMLAFGCGGSMPPAEDSGTQAPGDDPWAALDQAEQEVHLALGVAPTRMTAGPIDEAQGGAVAQQAVEEPTYATPPTAPTAYAPPPGEAVGKTEAEAKRAEGPARPADAAPKPVSADPCSTACRALDSMERAATHLCDLAGAEAARCASAKDRLRKAEELVRQRCPGCAG
ncbi:hypothetical protein [Polyangium spumosum]|uniref:Uncharacterized protein n=1 Tax=Polyangium spumosum TaxID=889282 RepID=A0A6N7PJ53_9BACT|nr:hypothetical protein [Polyangium spumosum]MRG90856.1 hypothetical protein [Polyangium spumosum]